MTNQQFEEHMHWLMGRILSALRIKDVRQQAGALVQIHDDAYELQLQSGRPIDEILSRLETAKAIWRKTLRHNS